MNITPELDHLISLVAEAKMRLMVAAASRKDHDFNQNLRDLSRATTAARTAFDAFINAHDGNGPKHLYIQLRACELGVKKLREGLR